MADEKAAKKAKAASKAKAATPAQAVLPELAKHEKSATAPAAEADSKARTASTEVRYRHPDLTQTWTGRGRAPKWVRDWIDAGQTLDSLQVSPTPAAPLQVQVMQ